MTMSSRPAFLFGLVLERRFAEHQVFVHNGAIDFSMTAVTMHKRQRLEKPNPVVMMYTADLPSAVAPSCGMFNSRRRESASSSESRQGRILSIRRTPVLNCLNGVVAQVVCEAGLPKLQSMRSRQQN